MPKVSILLTSYNHADYVGESIESVLNQTYKDFELYIIDDCSTDNSWNVIKKYKDKRIIAIRNRKNMGKNFTNELISKFKGEYIAIAHCDDKWEKDKLKKQVEYLDNHKKVGACFTHVKLIDEEGLEIINENEEKYTNFNIKNKTRYEWLNYFFIYGNKFCHPSVLLRKKVQVGENLQVYGLGAIPDLYRWVKLLLKYDIHIIEEKLTCFRIRINGANTSGRNPENIIRNYYDVYQLLNLYRNIKEKNEFLKVFPEAKKYVVKNDIVIEYAFAKICMNVNNSLKNTYTFFGLNLLFEILQDDEKRNKIEKLYNYTSRDLKKDTGANDFFKVISHDNFMDTSIYYQTNNSFNEKEKLFKKVYINSDGSFNVVFNLHKNDINKIRIDLDEDVYREYEKLEIKINGKIIKPKYKNVYYGKYKIVFLTVDPQIIINIKEKIDSIEITGKTNQIPLIDMEGRLKRVYQRKILMKLKSYVNRKRR